MPGMTGGARGGCNAVEPSKNLGADLAYERDVECVWQPLIGMPVEDDPVVEALLQALPEAITQVPYAVHGYEIAREFAGCPKSDSQHGTLRPCTAAAFVATSVDQRLKRRAAAHVERTHALRRIDLVAGNGEEVDAKHIDVRGNLADRLCRVGMQQNAVRAGDATNLDDRLDRADLVVGMHDADEDGPRRDRPSHIVGIDAADPIDGNNGDREALLLKEAAGSEDRGMLHRARDDMVALVLQRPGYALEGQVVGLAASTGEDDLVAFGAKQRSDLAARLLQCGACTRSSPMSARRIAETIPQERPHRGSHRRIDWCAGVVVEVDARHRQNSRTFSASIVSVASPSIVLRRAAFVRSPLKSEVLSTICDRQSCRVPAHHAATQYEDIPEAGRVEDGCRACGTLIGLADEDNRCLHP